MSFLLDFTEMIASELNFTLDIDIFYGSLPINYPEKYILIVETAGGTETESGIINQPIQVLCQDKSFYDAELLAHSVHDLLAQKKGFSDINLSTVCFCDVINRPHFISRGSNDEYIFNALYLVRKL